MCVSVSRAGPDASIAYPNYNLNTNIWTRNDLAERWNKVWKNVVYGEDALKAGIDVISLSSEQSSKFDTYVNLEWSVEVHWDRE